MGLTVRQVEAALDAIRHARELVKDRIADVGIGAVARACGVSTQSLKSGVDGRANWRAESALEWASLLLKKNPKRLPVGRPPKEPKE